MKVCHFTVAHQAEDVRIYEKECKSLKNNGYDVCIVAPNTVSRIESGIRIIGVNVSTNPIKRLIFGARKIYKTALLQNVDIYHFHDIELYGYGLKLKKKGKKVIFDSHEDWVEYAKEIRWLPRIFKRIASKIIQIQYKLSLESFDSVITVSPHIVESLSKYRDKPINLITNYPIINRSEISNLSLADYLKRENILCYAGTVYENSNQENIIKAIYNIDNIVYLLIGMITENYIIKLSKLNGWGKVHFVNKIPKCELIKKYNDVTIGIVVFDYSLNCGGRKGTMGNNKIFEYMLAGLPIVCTNFQSWKNLIIDKYDCGICVEPGNVKEIYDAINILNNNKKKAYEMGINARNAVLTEFNWETQERELLKLYREL